MHTECPLCARKFTRRKFDTLLFCGFRTIDEDHELELRKCLCNATLSIELHCGLRGNHIIRGQIQLLTH